MKTRQNIRQGRKKRFLGWILFYLLVLVFFIGQVLWQASKVNTFEFPNGKIQLTSSKPQYKVGDPVQVTVQNGLAKNITLVDNCPQEPLHVYQWSSSRWVRIHDTADVAACSHTGKPANSIVKPGTSSNVNYTAWSHLFAKPGIYRVVALAQNYTDLPYVDFQVVAAAKPAPTPQVIYQPVYNPVYVPVYITAPRDRAGD